MKILTDFKYKSENNTVGVTENSLVFVFVEVTVKHLR